MQSIYKHNRVLSAVAVLSSDEAEQTRKEKTDAVEIDQLDASIKFPEDIT